MKLPTLQLPPFSHYFISLLGPNILLSTLFSNTLALPLMLETKFHTHTKQLADLWFNLAPGALYKPTFIKRTVDSTNLYALQQTTAQLML
jgi:hypothetical protein